MNYPFSNERKVIDVGSTGSRLHIFELVATAASESSDAPDTRIKCLRRGSSKAWTPLSAFAPNGDAVNEQTEPLNSTHVAHHMLPLFDYASIIIPPVFHPTTPVRIAATAGMRLLPLEQQSLIYDALYEGLSEQQQLGQFTFTGLKREDIFTLDGEREGFFGAVAANYLRGVIDAELKVIVDSDADELDSLMEEIVTEDVATDSGLCTNKFGMCEQNAENVLFGPSHHYVPQSKHDVRIHGPLGALDMGGSSTQIVYRRKGVQIDDATLQNNGVIPENELENIDYDVPSHLHDDEFFSVSYLSYGADQFRERLWDLWVYEAQQKANHHATNNINDNKNVILNPCSFVGYEIEYKGYILLGTGNAIQCSEQVNRLIPYHDDIIDLDELYDENKAVEVDSNQLEGDKSKLTPKKKLVGGVEHPPLRGKFYGMSLYFFTLDCLRELSDPDHPIHLSWPTPSIEELSHALDTFCARRWQGDLEEVQHEAHEHTRAEVLPHRCIEAVYMVTLLRDGFGFHPSSRDITFIQHVEGNEVEWSLGLALYEFAAERKRLTSQSGIVE
ncbi:hypothetical protein HJC23_012470 [Cyclotella cryptica]|uniref:Nucleoside phosphatase GDA1/CD39 n=1 Tax=Cyclotella cryptica TaxID=29204 RepID=A0ABD3PAS6_9STRA